jgi:hypothetical protein
VCATHAAPCLSISIPWRDEHEVCVVKILVELGMHAALLGDRGGDGVRRPSICIYSTSTYVLVQLAN